MNRISRTLLIVEDSAEKREVYRSYLIGDQDYCYYIVEATLGRQGLELWQQHKPDGVLLDYRLRDLDGLEFLAQLQSLTQKMSVPVIVVTEQGNEALAVQAMKAGAQDYLVKEQITPQRLRLTVNQAIETVHLRTQLQQRIEAERNELVERTRVESEERFRQLAENIDLVLWITEMPEHRVSYVSPAYKKLWGLNPQELYADQQIWVSRIHPEDRESTNQAFQEKAAVDQFAQEYRIILPDGSIRWVHERCFGLRNEAGEIYRFIGIAEDITVRKRADLICERERQFSTLAEAAPTAIFRFNTDNNCVYVNRRWCEMTGQPPEAALGMRWVQTVHPDDRDDVAKAWLEWCANAESQGVFHKEGRCVRPDGSVIDYICQALPEINSEGNVVGYIGTLTDITESKQVEEALRQSEERYRCLAELIPQLIWTASPEGKLLDVNHRFLEFTGFVIDQVPKPVKNLLLHPEDLPVVAEIWNEALQQGIYYQAEGRIRRADGVYRWHLNQAIPQKNQQGQIVKWFGTLTDIEAQKQLEIERDRLLQLERTAREVAENANRIKDEFLAILSHELRSPLNPILGWTKLLQTGRLDQAKTAEALAIIERSVKVQTQLIDDLLDVAKILRGKLTMNVAPVDLALIIESAIDTVTTAAIAKSIVLHPVLSNIVQVFGDANRLQQVVWNLLSNAIKFTPNGGRVEIRLDQVNDHAQIIITDTGIGIKPDFLPHIFESFRQEDVSITRKYGGLGLGLAIVRQLVEAHGGTIMADSPGEGLGATFTVRLPLLNVAMQIQQTDDESLQQVLDLTGIRVLAVDDDPDTRELLKVLLTQYGAEVLIVTSGTEVLENLESFQPDVLVSDLGMPNIDGYTLIQYIRTLPHEKGGQTPAIALTAYARIDDHQRAITSGYQQYLTKPLEPEHLLQAVMALKTISG